MSRAQPFVIVKDDDPSVPPPALAGPHRLLPAPSDDEAERERKRIEKRQREAAEPVEAWDRYRALRHALDEAQKLEDLADHKARFALILMGALNALLVVLELRADLLGLFSASPRPWVVGAVAVYGLTAFYFFLQAIEALRPRAIARGLARPADGPLEDGPAQLRHHEAILRRGPESYLQAWREVRVEQLNAEIALQLHAQAEVNQAKQRALHRLYAGLRVMAFLVAVLVVVGALGSQAAASGPRSALPAVGR
jgi:hypothetical protein